MIVFLPKLAEIQFSVAKKNCEEGIRGEKKIINGVDIFLS